MFPTWQATSCLARLPREAVVLRALRLHHTQTAVLCWHQSSGTHQRLALEFVTILHHNEEKHKCTRLLVYTHPDLSHCLPPTSASAATQHCLPHPLPEKQSPLTFFFLFFLPWFTVNKCLICGKAVWSVTNAKAPTFCLWFRDGMNLWHK